MKPPFQHNVLAFEESAMQSYLDLLCDVYRNGEPHQDRTGVGTRSVFGRQWRHDMREGFPLLTTKYVSLRQTFNELVWFLSGSTNVNDLPKETQKWWRPWARRDGDLGPIYGRQLRSARSWETTRWGIDHCQVDQLERLINSIEMTPDSRRHIMTTWNAADVCDMALPCCHGLVIQFKVHEHDNGLSLHVYQRSADIFIGVPVNIASYGLLLHMIAHVTGYTPRELIFSYGDIHIYSNHFDQAKLQLSRGTHPLPQLSFKDVPQIDNPLDRLLAIKYEHIVLSGYQHHPAIRAEVAV